MLFSYLYNIAGWDKFKSGNRCVLIVSLFIAGIACNKN